MLEQLAHGARELLVFLAVAFAISLQLLTEDKPKDGSLHGVPEVSLISVMVNDQAKTQKFYTETLGLEKN